jgi:HD-GYP domain-containing protein (c-di-GMP phosphodiesterase class II)
MTALPDYRHDGRRGFANDTIARLPDSVFRNTEWATMMARTGGEHLGAAIVSGQPYRVANAIRSMVHVPSLDQVESLANAICDTIVFDGYVNHNEDAIAHVTSAREVVSSVFAELRAASGTPLPAASVLRQTVDGYVRLVGLHDQRMAERLDAVGAFAARIARSMKLSAARTLDAELAGRLHDVGMIAVPRPTRAKAVGLSKKEQDHLKGHPISGASFLMEIPSLAHLSPIVRSHHERYDGLGYPDGLRGDEIPIASRIINVAGAFVDIITDAPQFKATLPNDACHELVRLTGTQFDPNVVTATLHLLRFRQRTNRSA